MAKAPLTSSASAGGTEGHPSLGSPVPDRCEASHAHGGTTCVVWQL